MVVLSPLLTSSGSLALALRRPPHALAAPRLAVRPHMTVRVGASDEAVAELDERYLSVCLDLGQVAEPTRFWNPDGSGEVVGLPTFDFERRKILNIRETFPQGELISPHLDFPDSRVIYQQSPIRKNNQLTVTGCMPPSTRNLIYLAGLLPFSPQQLIY